LVKTPGSQSAQELPQTLAPHAFLVVAFARAAARPLEPSDEWAVSLARKGKRAGGGSMPSVLVTGSNRGIGLEWCRQYADADWRVFATCRHPEAAGELHALAQKHPQLTVHRLDVTRPESVHALRAELHSAPIDVLVNNAGVYLEKYAPIAALHFDQWQQTLEVNTFGPLRVTEALADLVAASHRKLVVTLSSHMGAIADISVAGDTYYRSSKAALNAAMKGLSYALGERGIGVLLLHPGWVKTRMGGEDAPLSAAESVAAMRKRVDTFRMDMSGRFYRYDGGGIPW
jgi:NAD(P)-dependent dehydrogenase (short-subunit alcohol dehydrogenase family)